MRTDGQTYRQDRHDEAIFLLGILRTGPEMFGLYEHFFQKVSLVRAQREEFKTSAGWLYTGILTALKFLHTYIHNTHVHTNIHTYIIRTHMGPGVV